MCAICEMLLCSVSSLCSSTESIVSYLSGGISVCKVMFQFDSVLQCCTISVFECFSIQYSVLQCFSVQGSMFSVSVS